MAELKFTKITFKIIVYFFGIKTRMFSQDYTRSARRVEEKRKSNWRHGLYLNWELGTEHIARATKSYIYICIIKV